MIFFAVDNHYLAAHPPEGETAMTMEAVLGDRGC
jgi:hypothetical protein